MSHQVLIRPVAMAAALVVAGIFVAPLAQAQSTSSSSAQPIDIPAMPLEQALQRFVQSTKFQLVYSPEILRGATSKPVAGAMTPREALSRMLEGTGVQAVDIGEGSATLRPTSAAAALNSGAAGQLPTTLESVTVTATKRPSTERELAGSVTALQGDELEQRGAVGYEEYLKLAPGVQYNKSEAGYATLSIRGLSTSTGVGPTQGATGVYIEDVPFTDPFSVIALPDLGAFDLERVEVLRGPQGVLFGSSSLGGALRFVLNKPNLKRNEGSVQVTGSQTSGGGTNYAVAAMGNFAAVDSTFGMRVVAYDREESGYILNTVTGEERTNATHQRGGRLLATWKPVPQLEVTGIVATEESKIADSSAVSPDPSRWESNVPARQPRKLMTDFGNLQVNYDLGGARLTSNTGYLRKKTNVSTDVTRALGPLFGNMVPQLTASSNNGADALSQEFRLANREPSTLNWLVGLFYQRFNQHYEGGFGGAGVSAAAQTLYGPVFTAPLVQSLTAGDTFYSQDISSKATETAAFGDVEWRATKQWSVTAGARAYKTEMTQDGRLSGFFNFLSNGAPTTARTSSTSDSGVTPKASVKFTSEGGDVFYALASKGYRFGGINFITPAPGFNTPTSFKSDNLWNYELGTRLTMLDRKLFVDVTAFVMDWRDAQFIVVRPDGFAYVDNVGKARSTGLELSVRARPTNALTLGAGLALTNAKTLVASGTAPANSRLPGTARAQGFVDASYRFDGPFESSGVASLTYSRVGKYFNDLEQTAELGGYGTADLNIRFVRDNYELTFFARNLTNEMGKIGATAAPGLPYADYYLTKPRTVGVTLRADF